MYSYLYSFICLLVFVFLYLYYLYSTIGVLQNSSTYFTEAIYIFEWNKNTSSQIRIIFDISRKAQIEEAFKILEARDGSGGRGYILLHTLRRVVTSLGEKMTEEEVDTFIKDMNVSDDGKINREQFLKAFDIY